MKIKVVPKLRPEVKVKVDIDTNDDSKIYYIGKFQDFTARYKLKQHTRNEYFSLSRTAFKRFLFCDVNPQLIAQIKDCLWREWIKSDYKVGAV